MGQVSSGFDGQSAVTTDTPLVHELTKIILSLWDVLTDGPVVLTDGPPKQQCSVLVSINTSQILIYTQNTYDAQQV
jgi:hypothetical protein